MLAFNGDVYQGLNVRERFTTRDYTEAQKTVRILSGLYGVLRPLDLIQPYRLEMGTRLATERGAPCTTGGAAPSPTCCATTWPPLPGRKRSSTWPLASTSAPSGPMTSVPRWSRLGSRTPTPAAGGAWCRSTPSEHAGSLAAWLVLNRVRTPGALKDFDAAGYRYDEAASTRSVPVFVRGFADRP